MSSFIQDLQKGAGEIKKTGQTNIVIFRGICYGGKEFLSFTWTKGNWLLYNNFSYCKSGFFVKKRKNK